MEQNSADTKSRHQTKTLDHDQMGRSGRMLSRLLHSGLYHAYSFWLFTFNDLKTIVVTRTVFGISNSFAVVNYGLQPPASPSTISHILTALFWVWSNYTPFAINNQRDASAIAEDMINKPWRPLPSKRISPGQAKDLMLALYLVVQAHSLLFSGGYRQSIWLVVFGVRYNNLGG
ncbi:hypothetical protein VTN00DRAFT_8721 [Thermoascus crustaceus]|uniref:uncharacterized protein n=1 Tax=Thermoascus crustaceus TaxID=5088 RepID=UPI00374259DF